MVNVLLDETFMPHYEWLHTPLKRALGAIFAGRTKRAVAAGDTSKFLPDAEIPTDFSWALPAPTIAAAFAKFSAVITRIGLETIPSEVRKLADERIAAWNGEDPGLSRQWVNNVVNGLSSSHQSIAKLVLLAALAPHQIDEELINAYRHQSDDRSLVDVLGYGSFMASRRIGTWLLPLSPPSSLEDIVRADNMIA
jgi:hypothetical protein